MEEIRQQLCPGLEAGILSVEIAFELFIPEIKLTFVL